MVGYGVGYGVNDDLNAKSKPNTFGLTYKPEPPSVVETIKSISEEE